MNRSLFFLSTIIFFVISAIDSFSQNFTGFFNYRYNEKGDKVILEIEKLNTEFLCVTSLTSGIGSNDLGIYRGKLGNSKL